MLFSRRSWMVAMGSAPLFGKASQPRTKVPFAMPAGACDAHTHIFGNPAVFPFAAERSYTPESALPGEMRKLHRALHVSRVVIVTPSVYGTDNSATLYGIRAMGLQRARGVAVVSPEATEAELRKLDAGGFRGIRLNFGAGTPFSETMRARFRRAVEQVHPLGRWHVQIYGSLAVAAALEADLLESKVPVVLDHVCGAVPAAGVQQAGFDALLRVMRMSGHAYVKVTNRFLSGGAGDAGPLVRALVAANPKGVLWGTDWPHPDSSGRRKATEISPLEQVDDGAMLVRFGEAVAGDWKGILVENPGRLYGFE